MIGSTISNTRSTSYRVLIEEILCARPYFDAPPFAPLPVLLPFLCLAPLSHTNPLPSLPPVFLHLVFPLFRYELPNLIEVRALSETCCWQPLSSATPVPLARTIDRSCGETGKAPHSTVIGKYNWQNPYFIVCSNSNVSGDASPSAYLDESFYGSPPQSFFDKIAGFENSPRPLLPKYAAPCHPDVIAQ